MTQWPSSPTSQPFKRGQLLIVLGIPGEWRYSHRATSKTIWIQAAHPAAVEYANKRGTCGMIKAQVTKAIPRRGR